MIMIGYLRGQLLLKKPNQIVVDVHGVGYDVQIPLTTFYELPAEGSEVTLKIYTHVREDALLLFGFQSQLEKEFFMKLISISGIGPKLAITILSGARVEELARAISESNLAKLTTIPGVGRKTAERVVLELKGHLTPFLISGQGETVPEVAKADALQEDVLSALVNLGYARAAAEKALSRVLHSGGAERSFESLLRDTLHNLAG
jgi:holliday junction DNA helicase RuvA